MKPILTLIFLVFAFQTSVFAQNFNQTENDNSVVMTWNKNTPEQEMKDDIKALKENNGVTIKYSNVKRNSKSEITSLKIEYSDKDGNSGSQEYNNKNAIPEIQFYKNKNEIGFGNSNSNYSRNELAFENFDFNNFQKQFSSKIKIDTLGNSKGFSFDSYNKKEPKIVKKSKITIQKDGRKPLVIEDGKVIEGQNDYSKEEIEQIQNENKFNSNDENGIKSFSFNLNNENNYASDLKDLMKKLQEQMQQMMPNVQENENNSSNSKSEKEEKYDLNNEMKKTKEEMIQAKKELEKAQKLLQKTKSEMKTYKI